ncbi:MAG: D-alanyl-D-alanine carboxypeptidase/D-alanyl-D-alanine endopeptidase [Panacagrimonas sp.]
MLDHRLDPRQQVRAPALCGVFFSLVSLSWTTLANAEWKALEALQKSGARISAQVLDLGNGDSLQQLNAQERLSPASVTKLVVAAAALDVWPAEKTFETRVFASGPIRNGRLEGDLILHSDGDATFEHRDLWLLAAQVRAAGVQSVSGGVIASPAFGPLACDNEDRCEAMIRSDTAYNAPLSSLGVDYGTWCVEVLPGAVGQPAQLRACGGIPLPIAVEGTIDTRMAKKKNESFWVERFTRDGWDALKVGGSIEPGESQEVFRAMSDPALGTALLLRQMLAELGVTVTGPVSVSHAPPVAAQSVLARTQGLMLKEQVGRMLRYSNNYVADLLTLNLAAVRAPKPPSQLADASEVLSRYVQSKNGKNAGAPKLFSGSGLTPENQLSAGDLVAMLREQYRDTQTFPAFYGGLVVPRQAPFAFLRGGSKAWQDRVALKTGTLNDPRSVCAVAGYLRRKDGGWMAFAILVNGSDSKKHVPLYKAMEAIRADVDDLLKRF